MITLYTFGPAFGLPDPSPFVMKAEMLLKLADLPYRPDSKGFGKAPKSKLPYIDDDGMLVPDSTFIRWHIEKKYGFDFDRNLSPAERGVAWSVEKLLEDNLYWSMINTRWMNRENFDKGPAAFFKSIPWPVRAPIQAMVRRNLGKKMKAHGMGLHSQQEIHALTAKGIESVAAILGDKLYLMGEQPCGADATLFAFVAGLASSHFDTPTRALIEAQPNLLAYVDRMMTRYFPGHVKN